MTDPSKFYAEELEKIRSELPEAIATLEHLKEKKKAIIALQMRKAEEVKGVKSAAGQEREAYASPEYDKWLSDYFDATVKAESLKMAYKGLQTRTDIWRTSQSTRRAEMTLV